MRRHLSNSFASFYKARNKFMLSQSSVVPNKKFGIVKTGQGSLKNGLSLAEDHWLHILNVPAQSVPIQGFMNPTTKRKKVYIVDGYDPATNTIYEYLGLRWHGYPLKFNQLAFDKQINKTYGQLYQETLQRFQVLYALGFKVFFVWEGQEKKGHLGRFYKGPKDNLL